MPAEHTTDECHTVEMMQEQQIAVLEGDIETLKSSVDELVEAAREVLAYLGRAEGIYFNSEVVERVAAALQPFKEKGGE